MTSTDDPPLTGYAAAWHQGWRDFKEGRSKPPRGDHWIQDGWSNGRDAARADELL